MKMKQISVFISLLLITWGCAEEEVNVYPEISSIQFSNSTKITYEESKSDTFSIKVALNKPSKKDEVIEFSFNGSATLGQDFQLITPNPLTIKAGDSTGIIKLRINKDSAVEPDIENCIVTFKLLSSTLQLGQNGSFEFSIYENKAKDKALVGFEFSTLNVDESSDVKVKLKINEPINEDLVVLLEKQSDNHYYSINTNSMYFVIPAGSTESTVSLNLMDYRPTKGRNLLYNLRIKDIHNDKVLVDTVKSEIAIKTIDANKGLHLKVDWEGIADIDYYEIVDMDGNRYDYETSKEGSVSVQNLQKDGTYYLRLKASKQLAATVPITITAQNTTLIPITTVGKYKFDFKDINDPVALLIYKQGLNFTIVKRDVVIVPPVQVG